MISVTNLSTMKFALVGVSLLVLSGCGRPDAELRGQMVGTWTNQNFVMTLADDDSFVSGWGTTNRKVTYQGTWTVKGGTIVTILTNCIAQGTTNIESVGTVDRFKIVQANQNDLVYTKENQTISLKRK
jgi:hypothetical protein